MSVRTAFFGFKVFPLIINCLSFILSACGSGGIEPITAGITVQPADQSVVAGTAATFDVTANTTVNYQWQISADAGTTFTDVAGATAASYATPATILGDNGTQYRVTVSSGSNSVTSSAATLTVSAAPVAPSFTTQPLGQSVTAPATATFTVVASGTPTPALQWQLSTDGGVSFTNIVGASTSSYTTSATAGANSGNKYRAVATNSTGSMNSAAAVLNVTVPTYYSVGGTLTGLTTGNSITLANNGGDFLTLNGDGVFTFATQVVNGGVYNVIHSATSSGQPCTSTYSAGVMSGANVSNINVICGITLAGTMGATGSVSSTREKHASTLLPDGKVLVAGGIAGPAWVQQVSSDLYDPATGLWSATGALSTGRISHTSTLLPNGKVLVTGGQGASGILSSGELYDPAAGTWATTGTMTSMRIAHKATMLPNGKVLVTGGSSGAAGLTSSELYDPATATWTLTTGAMTNARYYHTETLLPNGKVLVTGGGVSGAAMASSELYDPAADTWSVTGALNDSRMYHTATLLPNGKVLVTGGLGGAALASSELYDPATGIWTATTSPLTDARYYHTATLLPNGKVLVTGGAVGSAVASSELYDQSTNNWAATGALITGRWNFTATLLRSGRVLLTAGSTTGGSQLASSELYQ